MYLILGVNAEEARSRAWSLKKWEKRRIKGLEG
jgi:hypothetical protein